MRAVAGSLAGTLRTVEGDPVPGVLNILGRSESIVALVVCIVIFGFGTIWLIRRRDLV